MFTLKKLLLLLFVVAAILGPIVYFYPNILSPKKILTPLTDVKKEVKKPLQDYTFDNLSGRSYRPTPIKLVEELATNPDFTAHLFSFTSDDKLISGQINLPTNYQDQKLPIIIMLRGWIDPELYFTGAGTRSAAAVFARNGFVTIAPDFLGYGTSDNPPDDAFTERLLKPTTVLNLIESVKALDYIDPENVLLWGHSNGGQIALSVLEISRATYPTTLWAPVSKPFPYSILYYTDESDDHGKALRKSLAHFEKDYDTDLYSIHNYYDRITAPLQIHQGGNDDAVPISWSNQLVETLEELTDEDEEPIIDVTYYTYPAADHNLRPSWDTVVARDLNFFRQHIVE